MPANFSGRAAGLLVAAAAALSLSACARTETATPAPPQQAATPRPTPRPPATPPPVPADAPRETGSGAFEQFKFSYAKTGEQTTADFKPQSLPHTNQNVVVAAARRVIELAYGERLENFPRLVAWDYKETKHAVKLEGTKFDYVFVPVKDADRDIPQLVIWRVEKGTVQ
jgi:hypothetical protein